MIQGFLFDLDGTLVDTHRANFEAYKKALNHFDITITWEQFKPTIGHQAKIFLPWLAPDLSASEHAEIRLLKTGYYRELVHLTRANNTLITFMKAMAEHYPVALVTTAARENARAILAHHKLEDVFSVIIASEDVPVHKPKPDAYFEVLRRLKLKASEVLAFEDSEAGKQAAEAAGVAVVMVKDFVV